MKKKTLKRSELLRGLKKTKNLFTKGKVIATPQIRCYYLVEKNSNRSEAMFIVSKKNFRKAVLRNKIRRRLKEAYRINRLSILPESIAYQIAFVYRKEKNLPYTYTVLSQEIKKLLLGMVSEK